MNNSKLAAALAAVLVVLGAFVAWQSRAIQRLRAENPQLAELTAETERLRAENQRLSLSQSDAKELERLRKDQSELLRLRDELSRLRRQLKEAAVTKAAPSRLPAPATAPEAPPPVSPVNTYQATVRAVLAPNQALVTGGWATGDGKRTFVLIQPEVLTEANPGGQVAVQSRFVEVPEETASEAGFEAVKAEGKDSAAQTILNEEQSRAAIAFFESKKGVNLLASPKVTTMDGRQAQIKSVSLKTIDGETYEMGPTVDVIPRLSADRSTIEMTVVATLRTLAAPPQ
jgi:hypothetical protein